MKPIHNVRQVWKVNRVVSPIEIFIHMININPLNVLYSRRFICNFILMSSLPTLIFTLKSDLTIINNYIRESPCDCAVYHFLDFIAIFESISAKMKSKCPIGRHLQSVIPRNEFPILRNDDIWRDCLLLWSDSSEEEKVHNSSNWPESDRRIGFHYEF